MSEFVVKLVKSVRSFLGARLSLFVPVKRERLCAEIYLTLGVFSKEYCLSGNVRMTELLTRTRNGCVSAFSYRI